MHATNMGVWTSQTKATSGDKRLGLGRGSIFALRMDWHESGLLSHALEQERRVFNTAVLMQLRDDDRRVKWRQWHCTVEEMRIGRCRGSIYAFRMEEHDWWLLSQALDREISFFLSEPPCCCSEMMHYFNDACGSVQLETRGMVLAEAQYLPW